MMTAIQDFDSFHYENSWVTVGSFDGVHRGHQELIRQLVTRAHALNHPAVVVTFSPHPAVFFNRVPNAYSLASNDQRDALLKKLGVDHVVTLHFTQQVAALSAKDFVYSMKEAFGLQCLFVGFNFALGHNREGNVTVLQQLGQELGFGVEIIPPYEIDGYVISSSQIRTFLEQGQVSQANQWLGRPYSLEGKVVHGEHRGHHLGFPTANLEIPPDRLLPARGVYACLAVVGEKTYSAVTNIGIRPTFDNPLDKPRIEPHLLELQDDLYGQNLRLEFIEFLRDEKKFASSEELIAQVGRDIETARKVLPHVK